MDHNAKWAAIPTSLFLQALRGEVRITIPDLPYDATIYSVGWPYHASAGPCLCICFEHQSFPNVGDAGEQLRTEVSLVPATVRQLPEGASS